MKTKNILLSLTAILALTFTGCKKDDPVEPSLIGTDPVATGEPTEEVTKEPAPKLVLPTPEPLHKSAGWYARTAVVATLDAKVYKHTTAGVFGQLIESLDGKDKHDVQGYGEATLQIVFPQTEWGEDNGDYFSNYRSLESTNLNWLFQIKNQKTVNLSNADIEIILDGTYDLTYTREDGRIVYEEAKNPNPVKAAKLTLIDVDNHTSYTTLQLKTANLKMNDRHTRTFRWVLGEVEESDYAPLAKPSVKTLDAKEVFKTAPEKTTSGFGTPPQR